MAQEMKYDVSYDEARHLILGRITGEIDPAFVKTMAREVAALAKRHGCNRLLSDLREATIPSSASAIYSLPRIVDQGGVPPGLRRALIVANASRDFTFLETVALNCGHHIRIFTDPDAALAWLA